MKVSLYRGRTDEIIGWTQIDAADYLGRFLTKNEAADARAAAEREWGVAV